MTRTRSLSTLALAALALLALPLRSDGGPNECFTATQSYDATMHTVSGDESFFRLPVGPANVMFLLDNSGSMDVPVQCGDGTNGWNDPDGPRCPWPTSTELPTPATGNTNYTCTVGGTLSWMYLKDSAGNPLTKATAPTLVDPGHGTTANSIGLLDAPTWGTGCTGDDCLFDKDKYYRYLSWTDRSAPGLSDYNPRDTSGNRLRHYTAAGTSILVTAPAGCGTCLDQKGFCFTSTRRCSRWDAGRSSCQTMTTTNSVLFAGWWLNANPPKFMTARKVLKDIVWIDPTNPTNLDQARFGLSILNPSPSPTRIVVPVGPGMADSFPVNQTAMVAARQVILDALNRVWPTGVTINLASGSTPLAPSLADIGQYFSRGVYPVRLGVADSPNYTETTTGIMGPTRVTWATNNCAFCWACQTSAVLVVTDGSPNTEGATPNGMRNYGEATYVTNCGAASGYPRCVSPSLGSPTYLPRVAAWLYDNDLRTDFSVSDPQRITTSTIGFGIKSNFGAASNQWNILDATAKMGGGKAYDATSPQELADSITRAVSDVVDRANSFSAPAAASLSTIHTAASEAFITRFKPNQTAAWEGHVFQGLLFDEYLNGCDPTKTPTAQTQVACAAKNVYPNFNGNVDRNGFNVCGDVFLVDKDCDEVSEDTRTGEFYKKGTGNTPARMVWDAGKVLSDPAQPGYRTAKAGLASSRKIWTWLPGGTGAVDLVPANAATLAPYLNLDKQWCLELLQAAKLCGGTSGVTCPTVAGWTPANTTTCATAVINYVRGYDVLDADNDNCGGPGVSSGCPVVGGARTDGEERDRANDGRTTPLFWKLGDVFHSSPVLVKPPATEAMCDTGYEGQCMATLHSPAAFNAVATQTPYETYDDACTRGADAYEAYRYDKRNRQRLMLIGANDGMLHAFDAGVAITTASADADCNVPFTPGNGGEVWAFVPTDILPRLRDSLFRHQYLVDGSAMVRDVWVDVNRDGTKQRSEFRTVAVISERSGGSQYTALDVTDPASPRYLWTFPPPGSPEQRWMGQSWSDFAPKPPPIGPVRLRLQSGEADPRGRGWTERYVVMLNGGYDPALSLGAAVWMVDAITGEVLWRYTNDDFKAQFGYGAGTSMFPVPGAVALADIGDPTSSRFNNDGFFDTATWGDLGGNLFTARFHEPGEIDPVTKRVTNWYVARSFEQQRQADDKQYAGGRAEFFFMPELAWEPVKKALHVYLGSGNRERMMQQGAGCGADNVLSCCKSGCSATASTTADFGACAVTSGFSCTSGGLINNAPLADGCGTSVTCAAAPRNAYAASTRLDFTCPSVTGSASGSVTCDANGVCGTPTATGDHDLGDTAYSTACTRSRFFGVLAYGAHPEKMFSTAAGAAAYERARYTDVAFTDAACASTARSCSLVDTTRAEARVDSPVPTCPGGRTDCWSRNDQPGWFYEYGVVCPTKTCPDFGTCSAEKTGSGALVTFGCVLWNGFQPIGAQGGTDPCSGEVGTPLAYGYATDYVSGVPAAGCGYTYPPDTVLYRGQQRASVSPPSSPLLRVTAGAGGGVHYGGLQLDPGAPPESKVAGERSDFAEPIYWLEVDRRAHACRHVEATAESTCE